MDTQQTDERLRRLYRDNDARLELRGFKQELAEQLPSPGRKRRSGWLRPALVGALGVVILVALGFGVNALVKSLGGDDAVVVITDDSMSPGQQGTSPTDPVPSGAETVSDAGEPVELQRFENSKQLWKAWIEGDTVIWMESAGAAATTGLAYSGSADWDTVFRAASVGGGDVQEIAGVRLAAPKIPEASPYGLTLPLAWAEVLPGSANAAFKLVWAAPPETLAETYLFHGLSSWSPGQAPLEVLPASSVSLRAQASGDAIAIPVPAASFSETGEDAFDPANWEKLLMMTANLGAPVEVDPKAPTLPDSALVGLSPYFSLLTNSGVKVFDLRTGEQLALDVPASYPYPFIAGHYATWWTENGDVFLADLDAGNTQTVLSLDTDQNSWLSVALDDEWLVVLKPWSSFDREAAMADPSQHPGSDLIALHLPDLRRVNIAGVVPKGQVGSVQVSGDTVLLTVSPAIEPMPHNEPDWTALRALRLEFPDASVPETTTTSYQAEGAESPPASAPPSTQVPSGPKLKWGDTATLESRTVTVSKPVEDPDASGAHPQWKAYHSIVTITNTGDDPLNYTASEFTLEGNSSGSVGTGAPGIVGDSNPTVGGEPLLKAGTLEPGRSITAAVRFSLNGKDAPVKVRLGTAASTAVTLASWQ